MTVDQKTGGGQWHLLGKYNFSDTVGDFIELSVDRHKASADAIRLVAYNDPVVVRTERTDFVHADHLGTPRAVTDAAQTVVWRWNSTPFGDSVPNEDPDGDGIGFTLNLRFPGQYYDEESRLHYNYFRDFDPALGKYIQSDPIGLDGGLNPYAFVGNNPVRHIDRHGLDNVGCDAIPDRWETPCRLECCARHDRYYDINNCSATSWLPFVGSKECNQCNSQIKKDLMACGDSQADDPEKPNYYCASQHRYIEIPGDFPDRQSAEAVCGTN